MGKEGDAAVDSNGKHQRENSLTDEKISSIFSSKGCFRFFGAPHCILVVDDEVGVCESVRLILEDQYKVISCLDPKKVLQIVASGKVCLVLLDLKMPGLNGLDLLKAIKAVGKDESVEVALITGFPSVQSAAQAMEYGAFAYVVKPFDKAKLEEVVQTGIMRHNQKELEKRLMANEIKKIYRNFSFNWYGKMRRAFKFLFQHPVF